MAAFNEPMLRETQSMVKLVVEMACKQIDEQLPEGVRPDARLMLAACLLEQSGLLARDNGVGLEAMIRKAVELFAALHGIANVQVTGHQIDLDKPAGDA